MSTTNPSITVESSSDYLDSRIREKQSQILVTKQRLLKMEVELSQLKKQKAAAKHFGSIREQLRAVMRPG